MFTRSHIVALFALLFLFLNKISATHNRAGEITYKRIAPFTTQVGGTSVNVYTYSITVILYTNHGGLVADRCFDTLYFGDNTREVIARINGPTSGCTCFSTPNNTIGCGEIINNDVNYVVKRNIYTTIHTYPGAGVYTISTNDPNRNDGVKNMTNSLQQSFYIESLLIIENFTGANTSPLFSFPPIDKACVNVCFEHNPGAFDIDGDSLSYELTTSRTTKGATVPGYYFPETGAGGTFSINPVTGLLTWCTPQFQDEYNIAFIVKEWRKNTSGDYVLIGYVLRDMQVIVNSCPFNLPPQISPVPPICVEAGKFITKELKISDPNAGQTVTIVGGGGAFAGSTPLASLTPTSGAISASTGLSWNSVFNWQTNCDHVRLLPYFSTIKASDNGSTSENKLVSFLTFQIRVVPPALTGLLALQNGKSIKLSWNPAVCSPSLNPLTEYKIYRKNNCSPVTFDPCVNAALSASEFSLIGTVGPNTLEFTDDNNQKGLTVGQSYGYVVVAQYKDGLQSHAGLPLCAELKQDVPIISNVSVLSTNTQSGTIEIKWFPPQKNVANFDTTVFTGPYKYVLSYAEKQGEQFQEIFSDTKPLHYQLANNYLHSGINTSANSFTYDLAFYSGDQLIGSGQTASSIFLSTAPSDRKITLNWSVSVPWKNDSTQIYRRQADSVVFRYVGSSGTSMYSDTYLLENGKSYCYYVKTFGAYSNTMFPRPLINASQETCVTPIDNVAPVSPTASLIANCNLNQVTLTWNDIKDQSSDVKSYRILYKVPASSTFSLLGTIDATSPLLYSSDSELYFGGCYAIAAEDKTGNIGAAGNDVCVDICPEFELPNIFTPNADGANDFFQAVKVKQIQTIELAVLDRWGNVVYETTDPYFKWDGVSTKTGVKCSDGTLVYVCTVYEPYLAGTKKRRISNTVHLAR